MSNNIWDDENDPSYHPELDNNGAPPFEEVRPRVRPGPDAFPQRRRAAPAEEVFEDEEPQFEDLVEEMEDEDADMEAALSDARLRLEMGRLYEMVMKSTLFSNLDADPQSIKNVQRQIKRFAKEQMEIMLGMRGPKEENTQIVSPFNELEVEVLKRLAFTATKGASAASPTTKQNQQVKVAPVAPKATTLTPIGSAPVKSYPPKKPAQPPKPIPRKQVARQPVAESDPLDKAVHEMSEDELIARNAEIAERQRQNRAVVPKDRLPPMSPESMNAMYTARVQHDKNAATVSTIVDLLNKQ